MPSGRRPLAFSLILRECEGGSRSLNSRSTFLQSLNHVSQLNIPIFEIRFVCKIIKSNFNYVVFNVLCIYFINL